MLLEANTDSISYFYLFFLWVFILSLACSSLLHPSHHPPLPSPPPHPHPFSPLTLCLPLPFLSLSPLQQTKKIKWMENYILPLPTFLSLSLSLPASAREGEKKLCLHDETKPRNQKSNPLLPPPSTTPPPRPLSLSPPSCSLPSYPPAHDTSLPPPHSPIL